ncbi:lysophospholipid acyltransferase family protein [Endozoicomonas ascidiicola]|uniref:lysophospholipid acyltransferase family protein n=1 Tax=Endozoicomonas ascidiicola TaxID=1698521 RepID=UPI000830190D|nr:GNAT family N-acyltransferase [Endozoicomonas ascidiicola]
MLNSPFRLPRYTRSGIVESVLEKLTGLTVLEQLYEEERGCNYSGKQFLKRALQIFEVDYEVVKGQIDSVPDQGPSIVVANHPFGGIEGVALADLLLEQRDDVKVLTNELLCRIPEFKDVFIGVDVLSTNAREKNKAAIEEAIQWVADGHQLLIFPAGEVSSYNSDLGSVCDPQWRNTTATLALATKAQVSPVFIDGSNSKLFHWFGRIHPRLRTLRLVKELINKQGSTLSFRIGRTIENKELTTFSTNGALTQYLRLCTYLLSPYQNDAERPQMNKPLRTEEPIADSVSTIAMQTEIDQLSKQSLVLEKGEMAVYCVESREIPFILKEIGRLREITFREVGEGSGRSLDLDHYDQYYLHLFLWNQEKSEVVGAYRIGRVDQILREQGIHGLYSRSLFSYHAGFIHKLGSSLEMGRSFVRAEYQKSLSALLMLWKGIGAYVAANPQYKVLFGPVSISSDYSEVSRELMAGCLGVNNSDQALSSLVKPTTPIKNTQQIWLTDDLKGIDKIEHLSSLIQQIEKDQKGIPVLLRQYLKLRGELAAFNVDPDFNNALDGLIIVDLLKVDEKTLAKYMGSERSRLFLQHHTRAA